MKKYNIHKLYVMSSFDRFFVHHLIHKFKILVIPNILANGKSYEHSFTKKYDIHKLCAKSSFDQFFVHHVKNLKYWPFPMY
ncbi:hypothetical protein B296_00009982 [Ensete ventricosum]|uniref:Uncharacterized protein n=1 Tax=Ensete ventricosum TaxID=4639 RepID=A0A426ZW06_ENSVE|nr:hypothetical protein B296_00009982 [Ensete ventricosum]